MEGIVLEQRDILRSIMDNDIGINCVRAIGGPTRSELWNQIQADIYGLPVETLRVTDAAVLGAGLAGPVGVGIFKDIREAVNVLVKPDKRYEPLPGNVSVYDELFDLYVTTYETLDASGAYQDIAALQRQG
jgi:xylulokinase